MTETGNTVERLRHQVKVGSRSIEWDEDFVEDSLPALLAVVEAAQEAYETETITLRLGTALAALHTQASDEGAE